MPVWNGEKYLRETIDSILAQTFSDFELIVVDDGSTDATPDVLASYRDPRLRVIRLTHSGVVCGRNTGTAQAKAGWIVSHDADDCSEPNRLQRQWDAVSHRRDVVLCYTGFRKLGDKSPPPRKGEFPRSRALLAMRLCWQNLFMTSSMVFQKGAFEAAGGHDRRYYPSDDYALWSRMLELGEFVGIAEPLVTYRIHSSSITGTTADLMDQQRRAIGIENCRRFMALTQEEAVRAFEILNARGKNLPHSGWLWFLRYCAPRLRWKSAEFYTWLGWQTAKVLGSKLVPRRHTP